MDLEALAQTTSVAVRLLDNVIDASRFPLPAQRQSAHKTRRIGLGITGLADALVMLGLSYGGERSLALAAETMRTICHAAYRASIELAREKGVFELFERDKYLTGRFIRGLPEDIRDAIASTGICNSHLLAIAPTGTISLLAGNVSSGLEPIFAASYQRQVLGADGMLTDPALALWRAAPESHADLPQGFITASELPLTAHLDMQAALQPYVDNSISKTINVPEQCPFDEFRAIYDMAYERGLKGCTTFRPNRVTGSVLVGEADSAEAPGVEAPHCCALEREPD
jgi:ribonucleoside-diphosphate reductase alpha chain